MHTEFSDQEKPFVQYLIDIGFAETIDKGIILLMFKQVDAGSWAYMFSEWQKEQEREAYKRKCLRKNKKAVCPCEWLSTNSVKWWKKLLRDFQKNTPFKTK